METETITAPTSEPTRQRGLTITCDHCTSTAVWRYETPAADHPGADVHWTCDDHRPAFAGISDDTLREWRTGAWYANRTDLMAVYTDTLRARKAARSGLPVEHAIHDGVLLTECTTCELWFYPVPGQQLHGPGVCQAAR